MSKDRTEKPRSGAETKAGSAPLRLIGGQYDIVNRWPTLVLTGLTFLLTLPLFAPRSFAPLAYVALVPWIVSVCIATRTRWVYGSSYLLGTAFFLTHWRWLYQTTPPGYFAGSLAFALTFLLAAWLVRHAYRRRNLSLAILLPVIWTATELLRSRGPLSFPWFLLGHSQIKWLTVIQISDLTGVLGVSFVVTLVNGWLVDLLLKPILIWHGGRVWPPRIGPLGTGFMILVIGATLIYGRVRLGTREHRDGPLISVVQGDFVLTPYLDPDAPTPHQKQQAYLAMIEKAAADSPDMIVLPETPWVMHINRELREFPDDRELQARIEHKRMMRTTLMAGWARRQHEKLLDLADRLQSFIVIGSLSEEPRADDEYPKAHRYNSASLYAPGVREPQRYDKIHLVLFGEYIPFRYNRLLHPVYVWLNGLTPWGANGEEYSLTAGTEFKVFPMQERQEGGDTYHFGVTICYEDAIPQVFRQFVVDAEGIKRVGFMVNISNDGWFGHSNQQPQHLVNCAFRAVENRIGIARAVNTGVSGFIDPDGFWRDLVPDADGPPLAGGSGHRSSRIKIDQRVTVYSRFGDIFGVFCLVLTMVMAVDAVAAGWSKRRQARKAGQQGAK